MGEKEVHDSPQRIESIRTYTMREQRARQRYRERIFKLKEETARMNLHAAAENPRMTVSSSRAAPRGQLSVCVRAACGRGLNRNV